MSARPNHGIHGYWIPNTISTCKCSECGFIIGDEDAIQEDICPDCGCYIGEQEYSLRDAETVPVVTEQAETEHDAVNHPSHYTAGGIECIEALKAATTRLTGIEAVCTANAIKYLWRWKDKNGTEDLNKSIWYIKRLIQEVSDNGK